jgi:hypothetical protein
MLTGNVLSELVVNASDSASAPLPEPGRAADDDSDDDFLPTALKRSKVDHDGESDDTPAAATMFGGLESERDLFPDVLDNVAASIDIRCFLFV